MASASDDRMRARPGLVRALLYAVAVLAVFLALASTHRADLHAAYSESGDLAANSLLVLDAKRGALRVGNYSRVGFNHPGPALLDVLAFGEWLFHDTLPVARSPLAGQLLGRDLFSAFWLVVIGWLFARWHGDAAPEQPRVRHAWRGAASAFVFALLLARVDHNILATNWFPELYVLPFAAFFLAVARLGAGQGDALLPLALALGTLVHGHAAFVAVCGLLLVAMVAANVLFVRVDAASVAIASHAFLAAHRRRLLWSLAIGLLFATPIVLETIGRYPGPVADYLQVGRGSAGHGAGEALAYVAQYWRPRLLWAPALVLSLAWAAASLRRWPAWPARRAALQLLIAAIAATGAVFAYAMFGIDLLQEQYVALFYTAVPAALVAWSSVALLASLAAPRRVARGALAATCVLAAALTLQALHQPPGNRASYDQPGVAAAAAQLEALQPVPLVLELDASHDWGRVWTRVASLQVAEARRGRRDAICIGAGWHIVFTRRAACQPWQRDRGRVLRVSAAPPALGEPAPVAELDGVRFYDAR